MNLNNLPEKKYYTIGEVAKYFDVSTSLLRFWEKEFDQLRIHKNKGNIRKFTQENIKVVSLIYSLLKEKKYTIEGAKNYLKESKKNKVTPEQVTESLLSIKEKLLEIKQTLSTH